MKKDEDNIELISSEIEDDYTDDSLFSISSWGADLSVRELIMMYEEDELAKPEMQRKYVWEKFEASRFIESILMGLPIPSIFLAQAGSKKLIVDGYQRIMTVYDYVRGIFSGDGKIFRLSNSQRINQRWRNKAFKELSQDEQRRIKSTIIHAIIFEQKKPANSDTSMYQVFERINTSGRTLTPQEIRNCVYQGAFNSLLLELNKNTLWRKLFGQDTEDSRMRDVEYVLRFFTIKSDAVQKSDINQISLKKQLNLFMNDYKDLSTKQADCFRKEFIQVIEKIYETIGVNAFNNYAKGKYTKRFHPTIFDAISTAYYFAIKEGKDIKKVTPEQHRKLLFDKEFKDAILYRTTDVDVIKKRISLAKKYLIDDVL